MYADKSLRESFAAETLAYVGTRYQHQGRLPGVGLDCAGVFVCAARAKGFVIVDRDDYSRLPLMEQILDSFDACCDRVALADIEVGDVILMAWTLEPQHVCVVTSVDPYIEIVHASAPTKRVVKHVLDAEFASRVRVVYRLRHQPEMEA